MKKIVALLLALCTCFSLCLALTSCIGEAQTGNPNEATNNSSNPSNNDDNKNVIGESSESSSTEGNGSGNNEENSSNTSSTLSQDKIEKVFGHYSEGLVFVKLKDDSQNLHCIDKSGKAVFSIVATEAEPFSNGLAFTSAGICDKNGKITTAQDLGGTEFLHYDFAADYILVKKATTSFTGTVKELATFNTKFEKLVDFSTDFYNLYNEKCYGKPIKGFVPFNFEDKYLDLFTGKVEDGKEALYSKVKVDRQSELWRKGGYWGAYDGFYMYNSLDDNVGIGNFPERTPVLDLSQDEKYSTIDEIGDFRNGIAPVTFEVLGNNGYYVYYYTIMDEEGNFKFDPVLLGRLKRFSFNNGYFVCDLYTGDNGKDCALEVYDATGKKIAQKEYTNSDIICYNEFSISEGVITAKINNVYYLYDTELKPIF